jgi:uncharacterized protein (DUF2235 family)
MQKRIVIFADGTGNAFTTQESNVWRLYEALDKSQPDQIAYYIEGVGTSSIKVLSALDGATGFGVPSNVRELYHFLCRNWKPDDEIFMFGFSRGAFTIRTLIGLIHYEGLAPDAIDGETVTHDEMTRNVNNAWRSYRQKTAPWRKTLPTIWIARWIRNGLLAVKDMLRYRTRYPQFRYRAIRSLHRENVKITFAGLFDTVEAYGVPIEELRKAIDVAIWPISFNNTRLSDKVQCARHALSLDDERITFRPLRFDRSEEENEDRIKEVWFAGVHSDVGGGYPDYELALVPCVWMAEEAKARDLRFKQGAIDEIRAEASALGPKHDSRAGTGVFYRYAPRPLETSKKAGGIPVIHHAVAERMVGGSDNYAPLTLPHTARVLMPDGQTLPIHGFTRADVAPVPQASSELAGRMSTATAAVEQLREPKRHLVEQTLGAVWWRRVAYFFMLAAAAVVVAWPWMVEEIDDWTRRTLKKLPFGDSLGRWYGGLDSAIAAVLDDIRNAVGGLVPGYLKGWADALADYPILTLLLILIAVWLWRSGGRLGARINDRARIAWGLSTHAPRGEISDGRSLKIAAVSRTPQVRWLYRMLNTYVVPTTVIVLVAAVVAVAVARAVFTAETGIGMICKPPWGATPEPVGQTPIYAWRKSEKGEPEIATFKTDDICWWTGLTVEKGRKYTIGIEMDDRWFDRSVVASPYGFESPDWRFSIFVPFRRWIGAKWFQPVVKIDAQDTYEQILTPIGGGLPDAEPVRAQVSDDQLGSFEPISKLKDEKVLEAANRTWDEHQPARRKRFVAEFTADNDGDLFLYVNDAVNVFWVYGGYALFYGNNSGTAKVWLQQKPLPDPPPEPPKS